MRRRLTLGRRASAARLYSTKRPGWTGIGPKVRGDRMRPPSTRMEPGAVRRRLVIGSGQPRPWPESAWSSRLTVNHRLESRMREIRPSGSAGGGAGDPTGSSYPDNCGLGISEHYCPVRSQRAAIGYDR